MLPTVLVEVLIIMALIMANGFFSGAEIAIIAARRGRLQQLADEGSKPARIALELADDPNRFLPTVQLGITLVGTFAAAFGGARLADIFAAWLVTAGMPQGYAEGLGLAFVVAGITYFSVLLGELVPKRLALRSGVGLALVVARPMHWLSAIGRPFVWFMGVSTNFVLAILRSKDTPESGVSMEDIEHLIMTGTQSGVLEPAEQRLALEALRLGEHSVRDIMRPRVDIDALDVNTPPEETLGAVAMAGMSRLPLYDGNLDHIIGFVNIKDVLRRHYLGFPVELRKIMHPVLFVPETLTIDRLLVLFQEQGNHIAVVLDEFGGTEGLVTLQDVLDELVGEIRDEHQRDDGQNFVQRDEDSWLIDGAMPIDDVCERLGVTEPDDDDPRGYNTLAGLVMALLERIPKIGDQLDWHEYRLEVVDMDGARIDRVLATRRVAEEGGAKA